MKINFNKLAESFGVELNEVFKIEGYIGDCVFREDGFYRRAYTDNPWTILSYINLDREVNK